MVLTKGNVVVDKIKIGDIHFEFDLGLGIESEVITLPVRSSDGVWAWKSKNVRTGKEIDYMVNEKFPACYSVNLYDYEAYGGVTWI